jgi:hypothetical protein
MGIRDKDRKILWGRAGNRCAICHKPLVVDATSADPEAVVGDEAHIVAQSSDGPRGGEPARGRDLDNYDNLILLCRVDHKRIDDQPNHYTTGKLHEVKSHHEQWVRTTLDDSEGICIGPYPSRPLTHLHPLTTGRGVWDTISGVDAYEFDLPSDAQIGSELVDAADEFLQLCHDCGEISDDIIGYGRSHVRQAQRELQEHIKRLAEGGLLVFGGREHQILRGGGSPPTNWVVAVLAVLPADPSIIQFETDGEGSARRVHGDQARSEPG